MGKVIVLGNLKGGVGKTSLTITFANYLHKTFDKKILVIDCDTLQQSIKEDNDFQKEIGTNEKKLYEVLAITPLDAAQNIEYMIDDYDYIFIDIPGNFMEEGVISVAKYIDYLLVPLSVSDKDERSTTKFFEILAEKILPRRKEAGLDMKIAGIFSKVNIKGVLYKDFMERIENGEIPIPFFKSVIPHSEKYEALNNTGDLATYKTKNFNSSHLNSEFKEFLDL